MKAKKIITRTVEVELKEEDQFFMIGDYNVSFYWDACLDEPKHDIGAKVPIPKREYYLAEIQKFDGDKELIRRHIYVLAADEYTYSAVWEELHKENVLESLTKYASENSRYVYDGTGLKKEGTI